MPPSPSCTHPLPARFHMQTPPLCPRRAKVQQYQAEKYREMGFIQYAASLEARAAATLGGPRHAPPPAGPGAAAGGGGFGGGFGAAPGRPAFAGPSYKTKLCKNQMQGGCSYGSRWAGGQGGQTLLLLV